MFATPKHTSSDRDLRPKSAPANEGMLLGKTVSKDPNFRSDSKRNRSAPTYAANHITAKNFLKNATKAEVAVTVMKKLSSTIGEKIVDKGSSTFDTLGYVRTDACAVVLTRKHWRQFFVELQAEMEEESRLEESGRFRKTFKAKDEEVEEEEPTEHYSVTHKKMSRRIRQLWKELRIPESDRDYYTYSMLQLPESEGPEQLRQMASYIRIMLSFRTATCQTLKSIEAREELVVTCMELLSSIQRRTGAAVNKVSGEVGEHWKSQFFSCLKALQLASVQVVKDIQAWRRLMWRPYGFNYKGQNYLLKMASDFEVLKADSIVKILSTIPLHPHSLLCVTFTSKEVEVGESKETVDDEGLQPHEAYMLDASQVVEEEQTVVRALLMEKRALVARSVFIPTLKHE